MTIDISNNKIIIILLFNNNVRDVRGFFSVYPGNFVEMMSSSYPVNIMLATVCISMFVRACAESNENNIMEEGLSNIKGL